jgi:tRNA (Thr-GGU) A37 N-methylase
LLLESPRAVIVLDSTVPPSSLDGLDEYSHVWVLFHFHENTNAFREEIMRGRGNNGEIPPDWLGIPSKINPPQHPDPNCKVGCLACRSPHRYNPIGLSLGRVVRVAGREVTLAGLDLVDGTPILDLKPYLVQFDKQPDAFGPEWVARAEKKVRMPVACFVEGFDVEPSSDFSAK